MTYELHHGDCIDIMASLPAESVDAIVTSPPYAMQRKTTYGGIPEKDYPAWTVAWMSEAWRILKPDGSVIINIRPHRTAGQLSDYVLRTRLAVRDAGWAELDELIWHKKSAMPTNPPNRPRRAWESLLWFAKHGRAWANPLEAGEPYKKTNGRRAFEYSNTAKRNGWEHAFNVGTADLKSKARVTNVASIATENVSHNHPAPFPVQLAEWCGKLICPSGGTILDPFSGSASTGVAAIRNRWHYIGIDAVEEYVDMSRERLRQESLSFIHEGA